MGSPRPSEEGGSMDRETDEGVPLGEVRGEVGGEVRGEGGWRAALRRRLPVLGWARGYSGGAALADAVAGATLGLTLVPQSIAYAALANLPVQHGLYSAFVGTMLYAFLGTVKEVSIGPTSLMALMTLQTCHGLPVDFVVLLTFLSGTVVFLMGLLRLGFLVELISPAVTSGFTSATAVIVAAAQLKGLLGLSFAAESAADNVRLALQHAGDARLPDCLLSLACCAALLALRKLQELPVSGKRRRLRRALWLLSISRNALVVCAASAAAYLAHEPGRPPLFKLSGRVEQGVPRLSLPPFSSAVGGRAVGFVEMLRALGAGVLLLPVVMVLANTAIAKAFSEGGRVRATQEMLTLGLCNVAGSLVRAMPTCGAFTRSAVSHSSGVRTPAAALYAGLITLLALNYLTKYFFFIPKACLSSVLICAVIFMIDVRIVFRLWAASRGEAGVLLLTFCVGVLRSVELAVACGAAAALALALRSLLRAPPAARARLVQTASGNVVRVKLPRALLYANAERVAARVREAARMAQTAQTPHAAQTHCAPPVLLDCAALAMIDYTAKQVLSRLIQEFKEKGQQLLLYNASRELAPRLRALAADAAPALRQPRVHAALAAAAAASTASTAAAAAAAASTSTSTAAAAAPDEAAALLPRPACDQPV